MHTINIEGQIHQIKLGLVIPPPPLGRYLDRGCYTRSSQKYKRQNDSVRISLMILCYLPLNFYWRPEYIHSHRCQAIAILQWILASVSWSIYIFLFNSQILNLTQFSMSTFPPRNKVKNQFLICPMAWPNQIWMTYWLIIWSRSLNRFIIIIILGGALNAEGEEGLFNEEPLQIPQLENGIDYGVSMEEIGNSSKDYKDERSSPLLRNHCKG